MSTACVNALRCLAVDQVNAANSGHPGAPLGMAPALFVLWRDFLRFSPSRPLWPARDRFVLSNGHASAILYSLLHTFGYGITLDDLRSFRQLGSRTPGHPERSPELGIEVTTGALGQGLANAVGMAIASRLAAARHPVMLADQRVVCVVGDGCLQEGVGAEACSLAGHLRLSNLIVIYDDNGITIDGSTGKSFSEDVTRRFEAYRWQVLTVEKGDTDLEELAAVFSHAFRTRLDRPILVRVRTTIGFGSPKAGTAAVHGSPLGAAGAEQLKLFLGYPQEPFRIIEEARNEFSRIVEEKEAAYKHWESLFNAKDISALNNRFTMLQSLTLDSLFSVGDEGFAALRAELGAKALASRQQSQKILQLIAERILPENMVVGSADLTGSNLTAVPTLVSMEPSSTSNPDARYIHYGVREHAMAAISNGISAFGAFVPVDATFLIFFNYCSAAIRNGALGELHGIHVFTHDSFMLGEDGGTHHPVETMAWIRSTPRVVDWRPCSIEEVYGCYMTALASDITIPGRTGHNHPMSTLQHIICLSRQAMMPVPNTDPRKVVDGAYTVLQKGEPRLVLLASGYEVGLCVAAAEALDNVRVVSMPSYRLFTRRAVVEQASVIPSLKATGVPCLLVEPYTSFGLKGVLAHEVVGLDDYSLSGKPEALAEHFGLTVEAVRTRAMELQSDAAVSPAHYPALCPRG
ncbi:LOW QUALITY PROTEIN: uncharacterized protein [Ranitomeya imitator]|uniref:LOW QUALITY PROTEIN: uncharacterized protein n=1 Tax=Ranitomeya imitator TaxID=111125 RepID=UPI0037E9A2DC